MAHFAGGSTTNFGGNSPSAPQANQFWVPEIYSKKVQIAPVSYTHLTLPTNREV